ncbi:MAG: DUF2490 domain-containing protein [Polyangiales bacterium]
MNKRTLRASSGAAIAAVAVAAAGLTASASASAGDFEVWLPVEIRVPVVQSATPNWPRVDWRMAFEARFAGRYNGAEQIFLRTGPIVYFTPWFFLATHGSLLADALSTTAGMPTRMEEEVRAELEPNFFGRIGPFTLASRTRFEYRWRQTFQRIRLRTQLRVNLAPQGWRVMPFVQDELLLDTWDSRIPADGTLPTGVAPTPGLNQNRTMVGVGLQLSGNVRLDVGMLIRARQQPGMTDWAVDLGPWIQVFVDAPKPAAASSATPTPSANASTSTSPTTTTTPQQPTSTPSATEPTTGTMGAQPSIDAAPATSSTTPASTPSSGATN